MGALAEGQTVEAEIADCCQAIYRATEPEAALRNWARLRQLLAQREETENRLFQLESSPRSLDH